MIFRAGIDPEIAMIAAYAASLTLIALGVEIYGRLTHRGVRRSRTAGFRFEPQARAWKCSQGGYLWLREIDEKRRLKIYQADAGRCNYCRRKPDCTDSDEGRVLEESAESWTESRMAVFHRVFSLLLLLLAALFLGAGWARQPADGLESWLLAGLAAVVVAAAAPLAADLARGDGSAQGERPPQAAAPPIPAPRRR
ncbi:MAG: hypothetical protein GC160_22060 [Acidobacteria bacterium]|nr:hypothetical protein [Acidobacteriota bacterium]